MFTSRYLTNLLNGIHERSLRLIYNDYKLLFNRILRDNKQKSIYKKTTYRILKILSRFNTTDHE